MRKHLTRHWFIHSNRTSLEEEQVTAARLQGQVRPTIHDAPSRVCLAKRLEVETQVREPDRAPDTSKGVRLQQGCNAKRRSPLLDRYRIPEARMPVTRSRVVGTLALSDGNQIGPSYELRVLK